VIPRLTDPGYICGFRCSGIGSLTVLNQAPRRIAAFVFASRRPIYFRSPISQNPISSSSFTSSMISPDIAEIASSAKALALIGSREV